MAARTNTKIQHSRDRVYTTFYAASYSRFCFLVPLFCQVALKATIGRARAKQRWEEQIRDNTRATSRFTTE
jgi:hypothetical protein